jgi:hypothetical protein
MSKVIAAIMATPPTLTAEESDSLHKLAATLVGFDGTQCMLMFDPAFATPLAIALLAGLEALEGEGGK